MAHPETTISYTRDVEAQARELVETLENAGLSTWAAYKDLGVGQLWSSTLDQALQAQVVIILIGPAPVASRWVEAEWRAAVKRTWQDSGIVLVPVIFGNTKVPAFLEGWSAIRFELPAPSGWPQLVLGSVRARRSEIAHGRRSVDDAAFRQRLKEINEAALEMRAEELQAAELPE